MKLTQGNKSLNEYLQTFNNLARYATKFVDTDAKKIASFKWGLSPKLMKTMGIVSVLPLMSLLVMLYLKRTTMLYMLLQRIVREPMRWVPHNLRL